MIILPILILFDHKSYVTSTFTFCFIKKSIIINIIFGSKCFANFDEISNSIYYVLRYHYYLFDSLEILGK